MHLKFISQQVRCFRAVIVVSFLKPKVELHRIVMYTKRNRILALPLHWHFANTCVMEPKAKKQKIDPGPSKASKGQHVMTTFFKPTLPSPAVNSGQSSSKGQDDSKPVADEDSVQSESASAQSEKPSVDLCSSQTDPDKSTDQLEKPVPSPKPDVESCSAEPLFGPWTAKQCREIGVENFDEGKIVHNCFICPQRDCTSLSKHEERRIQPKKFQHSWLKKDNWWLCYVKGEGMYCLICRKHQMRHPQNQKEVFASTPSVRLKVNAINTHNSSQLHSSALENEMLQKASCFHHELTRKVEVQDTVLEQTFSTAYFLMKSFIANRQFIPLLDFIERIYSVESLKYFEHRSAGSQADIFKLLGQTVKTQLIQNVKKASAFGIMTDEVADISVSENLVTFIQFYNNEHDAVETHFLSCQNVLAEFQNANAEAIATLILKELEENDGLNLSCFTGFSSDGASVMVGKRTGVATRLKQVNPVLLNVHCICHRLALACTDSNESLTYIKNLETLLRQLWQFFENSPQRMAAYLKMQTELKSIRLNRKTVKRVVKRLKKACRTRWLSLEASVKAVKDDYEAVLQTLSKFENTDATASGLLKKMRCLKFIGAIYILNTLLPILGDLSRRFQKGSVSFAAILPAINMTKDSLQSVLENDTPMENLRQDIDSFTDMCADIKMNQKEAKELESLMEKYTQALIDNIDRRFQDSSEVLAAFSIFDPVVMPDTTEELKVYGNQQIDTLSKHYFKDNQDKSERLKAQWHGMKYHIRDVLKPDIPDSVKRGKAKITSTEWLLLQLMKHTVLRELYPDLMYIVEVILSLPVSNAWPERGASTLKAMKTRLRNRLGTAMLESMLHISINAPDPTSKEGQKIVKQAVKTWLQMKPRRKLPKYRPAAAARETSTVVLAEAAVQTEPVTVVDEEVLQNAVRAAVKTLNLEEYSDDEEEEEDSEGEDDCLWKDFQEA